MGEITFRSQIFSIVFALCLSSLANAQGQQAVEEIGVEKNTESAVDANNVSPTPEAKTTKKMVQDATINLQTTVTGNQEQPRVLYILPWQSPAPEDVDFESFSNDQRVVFGHVEREELRRELESAGEE